VSPILTSIAGLIGGAAAGLALSAAPLWRTQQALRDARGQAVRASHLAAHDDTTGLPNRRALLARLRAVLTGDAPLGVVLLDLDGFKAVNDTYGHETGNDLLTEVGHRLAALPHPVLLAARLSGDEYALLVAGDREQIAATARAAWRVIAATPVPVGEEAVAVAASVGYACRGLGTTPRGLLRAADEAMYRAKATGLGVYGAAATATDTPAGTRCRDRRP
jgi:diguanylate cyclase (GGDEF)-like protein